MSSLVARTAVGVAKVVRSMGAALDNVGKSIEITQYTEKLVPSTRFVSVDGIGSPTIANDTFIATTASLIGNVTIGTSSSVWYGAKIRGDVNDISIGNNTSIGDHAVIHVAKIQGDHSTKIGHNCTIGAGAMIHGATVGDNVVIGERAQVLDGSIVEENAILSPASIVTPGTTVHRNELWAGIPARKVRTLTDDEIQQQLVYATEMKSLGQKHLMETSKNYKQLMYEDEIDDIYDCTEDSYDVDQLGPEYNLYNPDDVQGLGTPGMIFRSTLSHPEDQPQPTQEKPISAPSTTATIEERKKIVMEQGQQF